MKTSLLVSALSMALCCPLLPAKDVSQSANTLAERGGARLSRGDVEGAAEDFANAIKLDRACAQAYFGRAALHMRAGQLDAALDDYNHVVELGPDWPPAFLARGKARQFKPDLAGAIKDFTRVIDLAKQDTTGYDARASARFLRGEIPGAELDCRQALKLDSRDASALSTLALISLRKGEPEEAIKSCDAIVRINERYSYAYVIRGEARTQLNDLDAAIVDQDRAIELAPDNALAYADRGTSYFRKRDFDRALQDSNKAIQIDPRNGHAYITLGLIAERRHLAEGAIANYTRAIQVSPWETDAYVDRGMLRDHQGDHAAAMADFDKAIEVNPNNSFAYAARAESLSYVDDRDGATRDARKAIKLNPHNNGAYNTLALLAERRQSIDEAMSLFGKSIAANPNVETAYANRARLRWREGDYTGTASDFDKAIQLDPAYTPVIEDRSSFRLFRDDLDGARKDANRVLELDPQSAVANSTLGGIAEKEKKFDEAIKHYDKAIEVARPVATNPFDNRGLVCAYGRRAVLRCDKADFARARADLDKAISIDPNNAPARRARAWIRRQDDPAGAIDDLSSVIDYEPKDLTAYENRGEIKYNNHDLDGALADYEKAIQLNPKSAQAYLLRANVKQDKGDLGGAMADRQTGFELRPKSATSGRVPAFDSSPAGNQNTLNPRYSLGAQLPPAPIARNLLGSSASIFGSAFDELTAAAERAYEAGEFDSAIELSNVTLTRTNSGDGAYLAFLIRGKAYRRKGSFEKALQDFGEAVRVHADDARAYINRALIYHQLKQYEKATGELDTLSQLVGTSFPSSWMAQRSARALNAVARIRATFPGDNLRNGKKAVAEAIKACELEQWGARDSIDTLAAAYAEAGDFDDAIKYEAQAMEMHGHISARPDQLQQRLTLYKQHKPYREEPPAP